MIRWGWKGWRIVTALHRDVSEESRIDGAKSFGQSPIASFFFRLCVNSDGSRVSSESRAGKWDGWLSTPFPVLDWTSPALEQRNSYS